MADFYCDHGAYGASSNRIGLDAPTTWGVPQEGDGAATAASTAAGVAEILINAVPTASETIVIAGATITAGASAGANTFVRGAATTDTAANIVTLINSANFTNTVGTSVVRTTGITTNANQGRNLFYARVKPGQNSTVQIMWRIGSTALDYSNNANVAITTSGWGTPPTITQFTGGESGCFGWFINPVALGQGSSLGIHIYGVLMSNPTVMKSGTSSTYTFVYGTDKIYVRTGAGQQISITIGTNYTRVTGSSELHIVYDSNTKWTGDSGTGVLELRVSNGSSFGLTFGFGGSSGKYRFTALTKGGGKFSSYTVGASTTSMALTAASGTSELVMEGLTIEEDPTGTAAFSPPQISGNMHGNVIHRNCVFNFLKASAVGRTLFNTALPAYNRAYYLKNCEFNFNYTGVAAPTAGIVSVHGNPGGFNIHVAASGCKITGLGAYAQPFFFMGSAWAHNDASDWRLIAEGISGAEIGVNGLAPWTDYASGLPPTNRVVFVSSASLGGSWRLETSTGAADWVYGQGFPVLNGLSPGGVATSVRVFWLPTAGTARAVGFTAPTLRQQSRGTSGTKTVTLELLVPSAITYDFANIQFDFQYIDTSGVVRMETKTGADLAASTQSWTNAGSYPGHTAKKITFTTAYSVQQYSDVCLDLSLFGPCPTGSLAYLFLDPGFSVT